MSLPLSKKWIQVYIGTDRSGLLTRKGDLRRSLIAMRREKVAECRAQNMTRKEISDLIGVPPTTVLRDMTEMDKQARSKIKNYIDHKLIPEFFLAVKTLEVVNKRCFQIINETEDRREEIAALQLVKDLAKDKMDLLTHQSLLKETWLIENQRNENTINELEGKKIEQAVNRRIDSELRKNRKQQQQSTKE